MCAAVVVLVLCACCSRESEVHNPQEGNSVPITFGTTDVMTKGLDPLNYERIKSSRFGFFAYTSDNQPYLEHRDVEYIEDKNYWHCSPAAYWPFGTSLSFFAYAPYDPIRANLHTGDVNESYVYFLPELDEGGMPRLRFTPPTDVTNQPDFCVSVPVLDKTKEDRTIHFSFHHTLTRVRFYVNYTGSHLSGYNYRVSDLIIRGVEGSNVLTYVDDEAKPYRWKETDPDSPKIGTYCLSVGKGHLTNSPIIQLEPLATGPLEQRYTHINAMLNGRLYLLPQKLTSSAEIELTVSLFLGDNIVSILPPFIFKLPENSVWEEEKIVSYMMTLDIENVKQSTIEAKVQGWNDSANSHPYETLE